MMDLMMMTRQILDQRVAKAIVLIKKVTLTLRDRMKPPLMRNLGLVDAAVEQQVAG